MLYLTGGLLALAALIGTIILKNWMSSANTSGVVYAHGIFRCRRFDRIDNKCTSKSGTLSTNHHSTVQEPSSLVLGAKLFFVLFLLIGNYLGGRLIFKHHIGIQSYE